MGILELGRDGSQSVQPTGIERRRRWRLFGTPGKDKGKNHFIAGVPSPISNIERQGDLGPIA